MLIGTVIEVGTGVWAGMLVWVVVGFGVWTGILVGVEVGSWV